MKKVILVAIMLFSFEYVVAQIDATVNREFVVGGVSGIDNHRCKSGDMVTIHAFKKKSGKFFFALSSNDFAHILSFDDIPFDIEEKQLKKLPNALSKETESFIFDRKEQILDDKKLRRKNDALSGKIHLVVPNDHMLFSEDGAKGTVSKGDTIYILGYSGSYTQHKYALYSSKAVGVFHAIGSSNIFEKYINVQYLPSVSDTDVRIALQQKEIELEQRKAELNARYKKEALTGKIKGVVSGTFYTDDYHSSPFSYGDTVSVIGYTKKDYKDYYAMYSEKGVGVFYSSLSSTAFKNKEQINTSLLPSVSSPEVKAILERQQELVDSLGEIKLAEKKKELAELQQSLIQIYKEHNPILITDITWSSNSVGGIEVEMKVTNCSQQTIKYITFQGYFENAVGDRCRNEIGGSSTWTGKGIGPIGPGPTSLENFEERMEECEGAYDFDNVSFYSRVAESFTLSSVTIQYMNGKTITLSGQNLRKHIRYRNPL